MRENLTGDQNTRDVLQPIVVPHFDKHPLACIYGWQHQSVSFKGSDRLPSKESHELSSMASHEAGIESDEACFWHFRPSCTDSWTSCNNVRREWRQLPQQYIRQLTGGITRNVEAVIQARGGCSRYWTLNHCRWVTHNWCFPSGILILSYIMNCEADYLRWTLLMYRLALW